MYTRKQQTKNNPDVRIRDFDYRVTDGCTDEIITWVEKCKLSKLLSATDQNSVAFLNFYHIFGL